MTKHHKSYNIQEVRLKIEQYCAYQDRCIHEVEQKLKPFNLQADEIENLIEGLINNKFIDENRFAQSYTRGSYRHKKWGWNKIKMNLKTKRISTSSIQHAYKEIDQEEYYQMIKAELTKKWPSIKGKSDFDKSTKLIRFGIGRGYEYDIISEILKSFDVEFDD